MRLREFSNKRVCRVGVRVRISQMDQAHLQMVREEEGNDFDRVIRRKRDAIDHDRLSVKRIGQLTSEDNSDRDRLMRIAGGFDTTLPLTGDNEPFFVPNKRGSWLKPRTKVNLPCLSGGKVVVP